MFEVIKNDKKRRFGKLTTKTGTYDTPFFMPVGTKATVKFLSYSDLEDMGAQSIISNSLLMYLKPGLEIINKFGGIHEFSSWKRSNFTDSGGFQVLSMQKIFEKINDSGIYFKSPYDGSSHVLTPKKAMEIQHQLGSDAAMVLDHMPLYSYSKEEMIESTERTHKWAKICKKVHDKFNSNQLLFGISQGGFEVNLRKKSAKFINSIDFDGISIGGLRIGEDRDLTEKLLNSCLSEINEDKIRYMMGIGHPLDIVNAIDKGIDIFDSIYPTKIARHATILTKKGMYHLKRAENKFSKKPLDPDCDCKICQRYSRGYLRHLYKNNEYTYQMHLTYHNIYFMINLMKDIRKSIKNETFDDLKKEINHYYSK
ncbi:MAG: tRNA guanosine(34) transglycosylase Tgt [Candidatus Woesearchaeota archaeon]